ncbi:MAG: ABC transporter permease [Cyclobacteriaceae bacterium]
MLKNIFLTSLRSLLKNRNTFFLNIIALCIGIAACIVAYLHINYELSYDRFHSNEANIFRVVTGDVGAGEGWVKVSTPIPPKLKAEIPEVKSFARLTPFSYNQKVAVEYEKEVFNEENVYLADPALFTIFDIEIMNGTSDSEGARDIVYISERVADKYFKHGEPIGKTITVDGRMKFRVIGVYRNLRSNSHFDLDFIIPFENLEQVKPGTSLTGNWGQFNYYAYVVLEDQANPLEAERKMKEITAVFGDNQEFKFENLALQSLKDIHFQENRGNIKAAYNPRYLVIYSSIAVAILLISFINFVNLNVAASTRRIKEVGVRKVLGASRSQLVSQFVSESIITSLFASLFALLLVDISLPSINAILLSGMQINFNDIGLITGLAFLILIIALFSGMYIALYILSFNPVNAVKGAIKIGNKGKRFKESLMVIQFSVSCILILTSIFIYQQLNFLKNKDIGLDHEGIITLQLFDQKSQSSVDRLVPELKKLAGVQSVSASRFTPGSTNWHQRVIWEGQTEDISWNLIIVDKNFIETFGIELIEGNLDEIVATADGQSTYIINQAALKEANWVSGLGKVISPFGKNGNAPIAGVARDFNYKSLHIEVEPVVLVISDRENYSQVSIKFSSNDPSGLLADLETKYAEVIPGAAFEYAFAEAQFENLYKIERQTSQLVGILTVIAITLALLGVYALLSFTIKERTKEIAIRKVLGIRIKGTVSLLSGNYIKLLLIGNFIGIPITWYIMQVWLQNFSYQISMNFLTFVGVAAFTLLLILSIVGIKVIQIEKINPTDALHYE